MKITVVKWVNVLDAIGENKPMLNAFLKFYDRLKNSRWSKPSDVFLTFNDADLVKCKTGNRIVFNVGGNKYRFICGYHFAQNYIFLFVKFVGNHEEYNKIDSCKEEMFKQ